MHQQIRIISGSAEETRALARRIGAVIPAGAVIAASGDLGAGKTVFAAALAAALGVSESVTSPTFIYYNEYTSGRIPFVHIDAYRLENLDFEEKSLIGLDDCFRLSNAVLIEWPQYAEEWLPPETVRLSITRREDDSRLLTFDYDDFDEKEMWLNEALGH